MADRTVPEDVLRIAAEHVGDLAEIVRAAGQELRADLAEGFLDGLMDSADGVNVDWDHLLGDLHRRDTAGTAASDKE